MEGDEVRHLRQTKRASLTPDEDAVLEPAAARAAEASDAQPSTPPPYTLDAPGALGLPVLTLTPVDTAGCQAVPVLEAAPGVEAAESEDARAGVGPVGGPDARGSMSSSGDLLGSLPSVGTRLGKVEDFVLRGLAELKQMSVQQYIELYSMVSGLALRVDRVVVGLDALAGNKAREAAALETWMSNIEDRQMSLERRDPAANGQIDGLPWFESLQNLHETHLQHYRAQQAQGRSNDIAFRIEMRSSQEEFVAQERAKDEALRNEMWAMQGKFLTKESRKHEVFRASQAEFEAKEGVRSEAFRAKMRERAEEESAKNEAFKDEIRAENEAFRAEIRELMVTKSARNRAEMKALRDEIKADNEGLTRQIVALLTTRDAHPA
mmetsp:Transcript_53573/g.130946  ORF Transcript_53573/g.130946 Transcript_53573/m.130946 type:complete len:379 (+) Transcript_53573:86-1222(+)